MAYISLDELKEILPDIFNAWMDDNDEGWEWIFQEIEQKCHIGKKKKDKKQKKYVERVDELTNKVDDIIPKIMGDFDARINALSNKVSKLNDICNAHTVRLDRFGQDIKAAKTMAQTAKDRTQVDYSKYSGKSDGNINYDKEKSDADVVQDVYNRMAGRGATREELDTFRYIIQKYDALEKKEISITEKMCETCKYYVADPDHVLLQRFDEPPCNTCNRNNHWEAKDNG